ARGHLYAAPLVPEGLSPTSVRSARARADDGSRVRAAGSRAGADGGEHGAAAGPWLSALHRLGYGVPLAAAPCRAWGFSGVLDRLWGVHLAAGSAPIHRFGWPRRGDQGQRASA